MTTTSSKTVDTAELLRKEFPPEGLGTLNKGGRSLTYVPVSEVIARLNNTLGLAGWEILESEAWRDERDPDWVIAKVKIRATIDGVDTVRIGWGGQLVKYKNDKPQDLGDEFKGASSDALKKAAQALGVALYLSRDEDMLFIEREELAQKISPKQKKFMNDFIASLDEQEKESFAGWFKANLPQKSLKRNTVNVEDFQLFLEDHDLEKQWADEQ